MKQHEIFIIGLYGPQGAGKSTIAKMISDQLPGRTLEVPFSKLLKEVCTQLYGVTNYADKNEKFPLASYPNLSTRELLQKTASAIKNIQKTIFIEHTQKLISEAVDKPLIVIPDIRHDDERLYVEMSNHSKIFKIITKAETAQVGVEHESEQEWKKWEGDELIINEGDEQNLYQKVRSQIFNTIPQWVLEKQITGWGLITEASIGLQGDFWMDIPI